MLIPGHALISRKIIHPILSHSLQIQPCGVDLSLKRILTWTSHGSIDFTNTHRQTAPTKELPFTLSLNSEDNLKSITLHSGAYLIEFNEKVSTPLDAMGQIFVRSSLFRSGASISAGVIDAGYEGVLGALLKVHNPAGLLLYKDARVAQVVFQRMEEKVEGYSGTYQQTETMG